MVDMTNKSKVEAALRNKNIRQYVQAIDSNGYATPGEVVLWIDGMGYPVYSVRQATTLVQRLAGRPDAGRRPKINEDKLCEG
jgi:hypothetical protein